MIYYLETATKIITIGRINKIFLVSFPGKTLSGNTIVFCEEGPENMLALNKVVSAPVEGKILLLFQNGNLIFGSGVIKRITTKQNH